MSKWGEMTAEYEWGFEKGVDTERERIIKLLLQFKHETRFYGDFEEPYHPEPCVTCKNIELIVGENK